MDNMAYQLRIAGIVTFLTVNVEFLLFWGGKAVRHLLATIALDQKLTYRLLLSFGHRAMHQNFLQVMSGGSDVAGNAIQGQDAQPGANTANTFCLASFPNFDLIRSPDSRNRDFKALTAVPANPLS